MIRNKAVSDSSPAPAQTPLGITDYNEKYSSPLRVALIYAFIGAAWILISDRAVEWLFADQTTLLVVQSIKGLLYVVTTTVLVYWLARRAVHEARCKCAEDQYRLTQNLLKKILSSLGEAVFIVDPAKRTITECNPAAERLFGFTRAELIGQSSQILHVNQQAFEEFGALIEPILEEHEVFRSEFRMKRNDETIIDTEHTVTTIDEEIGWRGGVVSIVHDITERKRAKQSLQESESHFRQLMELLPSAVYSCDKSGVILHYNPAAVELWGDEPRTGERFSGSYRIYLPDGTPLSKEKCPKAETLHTGKPVRNAEIVFERTDGTRVTSIVNTAPMANIEGEFVGAIISLLDITELKMAEESLLESGKRFKDLAEMLPEAIFEADSNLNLTYANKQAFSMFGYSKEDFSKGLNGIDMLVADDRKKARDNTARRLRGEDFGAVEYLALRKDGSQFPVLFHSAPIIRQGSLEGLRGIIIDITERKQAEKTLRESEELFRVAFDRAPVAMCLVSPDGQFLRVNGCFCHMLGYSESELHSKTFRDITNPDDLEASNEWVRNLMAGGSTIVDLEKSYLHKTGYVVWGAVRAFLLRNKDGSPRFFVTHIQDITERKRIEDALRESESRYRAFFEKGPDGIVILDPETTQYIEFNNQACRQLGYSREQFAKLRITDIEAKETDEDTRNRILQVVKNGFDDFETLQRTKQGEIRHVHVTAQLIDIAGRQVYHCIWRDVTDRKRAEEALRESEENMRYILKHDPNAIAVYDVNLFYIAVSDRYLQDYDVKEEDIIGKHHYEVFPEMPQKWKDVHQRCLAGAIEHNEDDWFERPDGSITYNRWECRPWRRVDGEIGGIITYTEVTTERKKAEKALQEREEKYRNLFDNAEVGIFRSRLDGSEIIEINRKFLDIVGMTMEETIGRPSVDLWIDPKERDEMVKRLIADGSVSAFEFKFLNKRQGSVRNCLTSLRLYREHGLLEGSILDITERKRAEEEKVKLEAQLFQAQKMESVGLLAGGVAHDFNNMLSIIIGYTEMAMDTVGPAHPLVSILEEIRKAANRSADLTRQLLAFARKQTIAPEVLDLNKTIEGMLKMLRRLIGEDIDLAWLPGKNLWKVKVDPSQIDQILANLCVNARDAISGVGKMTIETGNDVFDADYCASHPGFSPGEYVMLTVSDNGSGMDKATLDKIFEPFFTTKEQGKGTGLGLATVYGIVKQNDGFIYVYSEPEQGTTFTIYLPRHIAKFEKMQKTTPAVIAEQGRETILLVEDELAILKMTTMMLKKYGYTVLAANTPGEAIRTAEAHTGMIHLVMTDVVMPEMNGRDLVRNLLFRYPNLKRLFMSGYTANVIAHHGVLDPGVNFIQKPFSLKNLAAKVREALDDTNMSSQ